MLKINKNVKINKINKYVDKEIESFLGDDFWKNSTLFSNKKFIFLLLKKKKKKKPIL